LANLHLHGAQTWYRLLPYVAIVFSVLQRLWFFRFRSLGFEPRLCSERKQGKFAIDVVGGHDVDSNWVKELHDTPVCKNSNHKTRVIPRVRVEEWTNVVYDTLFATNANAGYMDSIIDSLVEEAKYALDANFPAYR
jgi:hypothetical protein